MTVAAGIISVLQALLVAHVPSVANSSAPAHLQAALALCPDAATLKQRCGKAKRASTGECLVCMSRSCSQCTTAQADDFCSGAISQNPLRLVVQTGRQLSLLDPNRAILTPLAEFGADWTSSTGSTGLGCNATHCISMGTWAMSPFCIGIFEKVAPTNIRAVRLSSSASFSAPAYIPSQRQWQVLDASGNLWRIDDALALHKLSTASRFFPPYYYHATLVQTHTLPAHALWCALGSDRVAGQVEGCFDATTMDAAGSVVAVCEGFKTNIATCGFSAATGGLVCAAYNGTAYGFVGFNNIQATTMTRTLLGVDGRTANLQDGFAINQFAVVGNLFVMLAQPNLGVQQTAELFVSKWEPTTQQVVPVNTGSTAQPVLNDGNLAWATF